MQKTAFYHAKDGLLPCKRRPFGTQKAVFCTPFCGMWVNGWLPMGYAVAALQQFFVGHAVAVLV